MYQRGKMTLPSAQVGIVRKIYARVQEVSSGRAAGRIDARNGDENVNSGEDSVAQAWSQRESGYL